MMKKEDWRDIPGYEGYYQASDMGNIRSLDRWVTYSNGREQFYKGRVLEGGVSKDGYRQAGLKKNNKGRTFKVSQIVAMTFLEHTPNGNKNVVDHKNGIRTDDRLSNLRIVTHRENKSTCFRSNNDSFTSGFIGVNQGKNRSKWQSVIQYENKNIHLGSYNTELEASKVYQDALSKINDGVFNPDDYRPKWSSKFKGISFDKRDKKWQSYITINKKQKHIGSFKTELEAYNALNKFKLENNI